MFSRFEKKEAFTVVGIEISVPCTETGKHIPEIVKKVLERRGEVKNIQGDIEYGVNSGVENGIVTYMFGYEVSKVEDIPKEMTAREIPAQEYAVIIHKGSVKTIKETFGYFYSTWLSENGYEVVKSPCFEVYGEKFIPDCHPKVEESVLEIYFPVQKKK